MSTDAARQFFRKIRVALGHSPDARRQKPEIFWNTRRSVGRQDRFQPFRTEVEMRLLLERFRTEARLLQIRVVEADNVSRVTEFIAELARIQQTEWGDDKRILLWKDTWLDRYHLTEMFGRMEIPVHSGNPEEMSRSEFRKVAAISSMGITSADFAIAESASVVLQSRPGRSRLASLMPSTHVVVIPLDRILGSFQELMTILQPYPESPDSWAIPDMTFISGPSKTADIEACMVHGAHGPREVYVIVLTDEAGFGNHSWERPASSVCRP